MFRANFSASFHAVLLREEIEHRLLQNRLKDLPEIFQFKTKALQNVPIEKTHKIIIISYNSVSESFYRILNTTVTPSSPYFRCFEVQFKKFTRGTIHG